MNSDTSIVKYQLTDKRAVLQAASEACHAAPHLAEAHYAYGEAWRALGDHARAEQAFAAALQRAPGWAEAWVNWGVARYRQNDIEGAIFAMRQALLLVPGHAAASANLGAFLRLTARGEEAELLLRRSLEADAGNIGARLNLVAEMLQESRPAEALALLIQTPAREIDLPARYHWHLQTALALIQLGRLGLARAELATLEALDTLPLELEPLWRWRRVLLAQAEGCVEAAREEAEAMAEALSVCGPKLLPEHCIMAHYDLARFWSGQNRPAQAMAQWSLGHGLLRQTQPFARAAHLAEIDARIARFDAARLHRGPRAGNDDPTPVFIIGMPRSGTTLCEQILAAHAAVHGAGERVALAQSAHELGGGGNLGVHRLADLDVSRLDEAASRYLSALRALAPEKARIVDKMPANYLHVGLAALMLPGAKFIHCTRDPRDIGLSIFTYRFYGDHGYAHDLADLGWTIAQQERLMAHWRAVLGSRVLTVRLQDWVEDFDTTLARVLGHLGLPHDDGCARFHESPRRVRTVSRAQVRERLHGRGLGRWRAYAAELAPLIEELSRAGVLAAWDEAAA